MWHEYFNERTGAISLNERVCAVGLNPPPLGFIRLRETCSYDDGVSYTVNRADGVNFYNVSIGDRLHVLALLLLGSLPQRHGD